MLCIREYADVSGDAVEHQVLGPRKGGDAPGGAVDHLVGGHHHSALALHRAHEIISPELRADAAVPGPHLPRLGPGDVIEIALLIVLRKHDRMVRGQGLELNVVGIDPPGHVGSVPVARAQVAGREAVRSRPLFSVVGARHPAEDPTDVRDAHPSLRPRERRPPDERQDTDDDGREHPGTRPEQAPHIGVTSDSGEGGAGGGDENPGGGGGGEPGLFCGRSGSGFTMSEVYFAARPYAPAQKRQFLIHFHPSRLVAPGSRIVAVAGRSAGPPLIDSDPYGPRPDDSYGPVGRTTRCPWPGSRTGPTGAAPTARACSRARR